MASHNFPSHGDPIGVFKLAWGARHAGRQRAAASSKEEKIIGKRRKKKQKKKKQTMQFPVSSSSSSQGCFIVSYNVSSASWLFAR
jgi:hypothetical protein